MLGLEPSIQGKRSDRRPWTLGSEAEGDKMSGRYNVV
jgi:hypothetical protein